MTFRRLVFYAHLVAGLVAAVFLVVLGVTGAAMVYENEIHYLLNAHLYRVQPRGDRLSLDEIAAVLARTHPGFHIRGVSFPSEPDIAYSFYLNPVGRGNGMALTVDPYTGADVGSLAGANNFMQRVHQFHTNLLLGPKGRIITGCGAALLVLLALSGLVLWWPRKLWKLRGLTPGRRLNFELHNTVGFYSSVFMFLFGATGLVIHWDEAAMNGVNRLAGVADSKPQVPPPTPAHPGTVTWLSAQGALVAAQQAVPGAAVTSIQGLGSAPPLRITMKFPGDGTPVGRTNVFLDPVTGDVLKCQTSRNAPIGYRVAKFWNREIHTGDIFGKPTRLLACIMSLALPLLAVTGPIIWWNRLWKRPNSPPAP